MQSYNKTILIYSFAIFAMFFGSGNLVFPIKIGQITAQYWFYGFLGLFVTGILLPFLGLFVVKLHEGNYRTFFAEAGPLAKIILPLFTLSLLGSFGVVPRCITVAYGSMCYLIPQVSLKLFSILFCITTFFCCLKEQRMINIIGKWMSPILLISLGWLIITGILSAEQLETKTIYPIEAVYKGFLTGYQTMDLFAAFFFSSLTFSQLQKIMPTTATTKEIIWFATKPSIIGASLLTLIYLGFVFLGSHFSELISTVEAEFMLATIANHIMGKGASLFIGVAVVFSCLTTAIALNNIYAKYLCSFIGLTDNKFPPILLITTAISFFISLFDFKGIGKFLGIALEISYPSVIILTVLSIFTRKFHQLKKFLFYAVLIAIILIHLRSNNFI